MISRRSVLIAGTSMMLASGAHARERPHIEAFNPRFWNLIDRNASIRQIAANSDMGTVPPGEADYGASLESPMWHPDGFLIFSDIPRNRILKWTLANGVETFLEPTGHANGLWFDQQNRLLMGSIPAGRCRV